MSEILNIKLMTNVEKTTSHKSTIEFDEVIEGGTPFITGNKFYLRKSSTNGRIPKYAKMTIELIY